MREASSSPWQLMFSTGERHFFLVQIVNVPASGGAFVARPGIALHSLRGLDPIGRQEMIKQIHFDTMRNSEWPHPSVLEPFFLAPPGREFS